MATCQRRAASCAPLPSTMRAGWPAPPPGRGPSASLRRGSGLTGSGRSTGSGGGGRSRVAPASRRERPRTGGEALALPPRAPSHSLFPFTDPHPFSRPRRARRRLPRLEAPSRPRRCPWITRPWLRRPPTVSPRAAQRSFSDHVSQAGSSRRCFGDAGLKAPRWPLARLSERLVELWSGGAAGARLACGAGSGRLRRDGGSA